MERDLRSLFGLDDDGLSRFAAGERQLNWSGDWSLFLHLNWEEIRTLSAAHRRAIDEFSKGHRIVTFARMSEVLAHVANGLFHMVGEHETTLQITKEEFLGLWGALRIAFDRRYQLLCQNVGTGNAVDNVRRTCHFFPLVESQIFFMGEAATLREFKAHFAVLEAQAKIQDL